MRRSNAWDFDDLLAFGLRVVREHPHRLPWVRSRWRWLLVDEFQDVNRAQAELVFLLAGISGRAGLLTAALQNTGRWTSASVDSVMYPLKFAPPLLPR